MYPKHIPGTWQFSGNWLGSYRLIATDQEITPIVAGRDILCPICEYPEAVHLSRFQPNYPLMYYCPECGTIWGWYVSRCPDCEVGNLWKKDCPEGKVKCTTCDMLWDIDSAKEICEDPEYRNEVAESCEDE